MSPPSLAFDIGQTGSRARVLDGGRAVGEASGPGYLAGASLSGTLAAVAAEASRAAGVERFGRVAGGLTGLYGIAPDAREAVQSLRSRFGTVSLTVADDAVTSYLGALGAGPGVVVAIGTGLVALGHGNGDWARVDGAGAMIGDEGAGWWIGRQGLIAALSALDGRDGGSERLLEAAQAEFGPAAGIPAGIGRSPSPIAAVAGFAARVADAARDGDAAAQAIWRQAAGFIGRAINAAARRAHLEPPVRYALVGGIARSAGLLEPALTDGLRARLGPTTRATAAGTSLDGAVRLLTMAEAGALGPLAHTTRIPEDGLR